MSADDLLRQSGPINTGDQPLVSLELSDAYVEAWVTEAHINEHLSQVSTAVIDFSCDTPQLDLNGLLGTEARLTLHGTEGSPGRHYHGLIEHISQTGQDRSNSYYQVQLISRIGLLNYRHNLRIFQQQNVIDIITTILAEHQIEGDTLSLNLFNSYSPIDYCVQYRETDLAFIQRLMSHNGLYSHIEHNSDHHVLHISDTVDAHTEVPASTIPWAKPTGQIHDQALIHTLSSQHAIHTQSSSLSDYNFHKPALSLKHTHSSTQQSHNSGLEHYDYPGQHNEPAGIQQQAQIHQNAHDANQQQLIGTGCARQLQPGYRFTLDNHPDSSTNQGYLITSVQQIVRQPQVLNEHSSNEESYSYQGSFTAIPEQIQYQSPQTAKPSVNGVQTAIVTGPDGEEIYTDEYGRVKVQFHWDREGQYNEQSSCWIRVGQSWAGNGFGQVAIPRIGQEVIVDFINGDPDNPIITGSVYHGINRPPYSLPNNKTRTVFKTKTHQGQGSNEIRFEDAAGQEEVYVHAQKDYNSITENDKSSQVGNDKSASVGHDETLNVGNDRTRSVGNDETVSVGHDQRLTINNDQFVTIGRNQQTTIEKDKIESVNNHRKESTYANHWRETGGDYGHKVLGSVTREVVDRIVIEADDFTDMAADELILKGPGGQIKISSNGVELKAKSIKVKSPAITFGRGSASPFSKFTDEKNTGEDFSSDAKTVEEKEYDEVLSVVSENNANEVEVEIKNASLAPTLTKVEKETELQRRRKTYQGRKELAAGADDSPEQQAAAERLLDNNDNILRAEAAEYVYKVDEFNRGHINELPNPPTGLIILDTDDIPGIENTVFTDLDSGFGAAFFKSEVSGENMLTYRGTNNEVTGKKDWTTNLKQGLGKETEQYNLAMDLAIEMKNAVGKSFTCVGHSLGGGLASAGVALSGVNGYTFNSAGLHDKTAKRMGGMNNDAASKLIQTRAVDGEVLTMAQKHGNKVITGAAGGIGALAGGGVGAGIGIGIGGLAPDIPNAVGQMKNLPSVEGGNPVARHGMVQVIAGIEAQKQEDINLLS